MKSLLVAICLGLVAVAADPNRLPQEDAQRYAKACVEQAANLGDAPIKIDADPDKACAVRGEGGGAMVVPQKGLSQEVLRKAGKEVLPLGQLWLRKWTVVAKGKPVPDDPLRIVTVKLDDKDRPMPLFLLGVRKKDNKGLELVVYAKGAEPLLVLPLKAEESGQELPLELEWQRGDKGSDRLTLGVLGKYRAVLAITGQQK